MKRFLKPLLLSGWLLWVSLLALFHSGVMPRPTIDEKTDATAEWIDKSQAGIHQLILSGPPYGRGLKGGELTRPLLIRQEDALNDQLDPLLPQRWMRQAAVLAAIAWFQGIDKFLKPEHIEEMYGVSMSAPEKYNYLADPFTRQVAYHGLHEVGQMMVDQGFEGMGCTVAAVKRGGNWILGRNFDFEGGRIFDAEKIMKWVFPDHGNAFVSIIWAGMVGAVTGVNEKGVYVSINAAGSDDRARVGNPSTLVILQVLQEADNTAEAVKIIEEAQVFISDIYVLNDAAGDLRVVEKTPKRVDHYALNANGAVANHLISPKFANDKTNQWRKAELTSVARFERAKKLVQEIPVGMDLDDTTRAVLSVLRDKGVNEKGLPLNLGNRRAIDALIATHAVIHDGVRGLLYVSRGPALSGPFLGFDLAKSFAARRPVSVAELPRDPLVSDEEFRLFKEHVAMINHARRLVREHSCIEAIGLLESIREPGGRAQSEYHHTLGDAQACLNSMTQARLSWQKALQLTPAYAKQEQALKRSLGR